jgi:hypothetical protein
VKSSHYGSNKVQLGGVSAVCASLVQKDFARSSTACGPGSPGPVKEPQARGSPLMSLRSVKQEIGRTAKIVTKACRDVPDAGHPVSEKRREKESLDIADA